MSLEDLIRTYFGSQYMEKQVKEEENRIAIVSEGQAQQLLDRIKGGKK